MWRWQQSGLMPIINHQESWLEVIQQSTGGEGGEIQNVYLFVVAVVVLNIKSQNFFCDFRQMIRKTHASHYCQLNWWRSDSSCWWHSGQQHSLKASQFSDAHQMQQWRPTVNPNSEVVVIFSLDKMQLFTLSGTSQAWESRQLASLAAAGWWELVIWWKVSLTRRTPGCRR